MSASKDVITWLLVVLSDLCRTPSGLLQLHTSANGPALTIVEPDLQSGYAIAHVIDKFAGAIAASRGSKAPGPNPGYASAMEVLQDPALRLDLFAQLVQAAGMKDILSGATSEFTLFAPTNQVRDTRKQKGSCWEYWSCTFLLSLSATRSARKKFEHQLESY